VRLRNARCRHGEEKLVREPADITATRLACAAAERSPAKCLTPKLTTEPLQAQLSTPTAAGHKTSAPVLTPVPDRVAILLGQTLNLQLSGPHPANTPLLMKASNNQEGNFVFVRMRAPPLTSTHSTLPAAASLQEKFWHLSQLLLS